jgi:hypothetical protein
MAVFNADSQSRILAIDKFLNNRIKAPYVYSQVSTLGGVNRASAIAKVSLDPKSKWPNDILHNSRYFMVRIDRNGTMEMFAKSYRLPLKMRKSTVKSLPDAVAKINKYISSVR